MFCCGLDMDLSGLTVKKNAVDPNQMSPLEVSNSTENKSDLI